MRADEPNKTDSKQRSRKHSRGFQRQPTVAASFSVTRASERRGVVAEVQLEVAVADTTAQPRSFTSSTGAACFVTHCTARYCYLLRPRPRASACWRAARRQLLRPLVSFLRLASASEAPSLEPRMFGRGESTQAGLGGAAIAASQRSEWTGRRGANVDRRASCASGHDSAPRAVRARPRRRLTQFASICFECCSGDSLGWTIAASRSLAATGIASKSRLS